MYMQLLKLLNQLMTKDEEVTKLHMRSWWKKKPL